MDTTGTHRNPLDLLVPDPTGLPALCNESDFDDLLEQLVADNAPQTFAVVQEYGRRVDGRIVAWGLAFEDHVSVVSNDDGVRMTLESAERVRRAFTWGNHITARLVWIDRGEVPRPPFPSSDHFPLGRPFGAVETVPEPPSPVRPFGLTLAVPANTMTTVNPAEISYDEVAQIGLVRDAESLVPLSKHTDGQTNTVTDGGDGQTSNRDSDTDHRED